MIYKPMHNQKSQVNIQQDQKGMAAIMVTIILMLVLTLIVLSFAKISRREQRNALDRQLSTQAFYAAESGINDARKVVQGWVSAGDIKLKTDYMSACTGAGPPESFASAAGPGVTLDPIKLPGSGAASYTCLFVDPSPTSLEFTKSDKQQIFPIEDKNGTTIITSLTIEWDDGSGGNDFSGCPPLNNNPQSLASDCAAPVLRVELVDGSTPNGLLSSKVFFLYPSPSSGGTLDYSSSTGSTRQANCNIGTSKKCRVVINFAGFGATKYYARIKSIYKPAAMTISANNGAVQFIGAQAILDATGKAADVERRIQVRIKTNTLTSDVPLYGLESNDKVCKQFSIIPPSALDDGDCWNGGEPD